MDPNRPPPPAADPPGASPPVAQPPPSQPPLPQQQHPASLGSPPLAEAAAHKPPPPPSEFGGMAPSLGPPPPPAAAAASENPHPNVHLVSAPSPYGPPPPPGAFGTAPPPPPAATLEANRATAEAAAGPAPSANPVATNNGFRAPPSHGFAAATAPPDSWNPSNAAAAGHAPPAASADVATPPPTSLPGLAGGAAHGAEMGGLQGYSPPPPPNHNHNNLPAPGHAPPPPMRGPLGPPGMPPAPPAASLGPPPEPHGHNPHRGLPEHIAARLQGIVAPLPPPPINNNNNNNNNAPQQHPGMRELRVEDALLYLDDVKREFRNQPGVYNEFLTIMKNFKTQAVDTPGVIQRVSKLFRGYNKLILGFNTFLPEGYKISLADLQRAERERQAQEEAERRRQEEAAAAGVALQPPPIPTSNFSDAYPARRNKHAPPEPEPAPVVDAKPPPAADSPGKANALMRPKARPAQKKSPGPPPQQHQVEFDHAISYVTQIKRRFATDPNTYHSFLEILHTYQKEQRGIKEVLEQVAHLFQDHPDLLKEFTFFLPDAVQEQAKERLHRAAAESESRLASQRQAQMEQYRKSMQHAQAADGSQQVIDMTNRNRGMEGVMMAAAAAGGRKRSLDGHPVAAGHHQQPENYVYNSAVERQFFDLTKEALTSYSRDGGQAWAEFMKCLDMYAQEILSRTEMLAFVEPLLGKRNAKLFDDFKRILASAGSTTGPASPLEDAWYSVPLSEIDFSRCRRCTPSYRALPRDYPAPPCTERSDFEAKVLNDIWVSLPVGSEESYTFRHMRRNNYEEQLFRCEDERFEIDMVIDSNAATLQRLLPFAEEIARLSKSEISAEELGIKCPNEGAGIAGKRFQYTFDKTVLGVIHRNTIARIYGDSGSEMLDLMVKNPVVAIPLVVERLRQKDKEWKRVRDRLRVDWKKLAETNYYKSLDHRSLTWRTTDKRATSTRTLLSEIKDRSQNRGKEGKEALRQKLEKAKEEHGTFFEVTKADTLSEDLDLTFLPRPDRLLFTPHLSVLYENNSWAQRDTYRILAFALERGTITPHDKERCHRLWSEFLGPWFGLSLSWMHAPAVTYQESSPKFTEVAAPAVISEEEEDESLDDEDMEGRVVTEDVNKTSAGSSSGKDSDTCGLNDYHPLPSGSTVSTVYGEGKILEFRKETNIYVIELPFGKAYLRPSTVLCSLMPAEKSTYTEQLRSEDRSKLGRVTDQLVIGTQSLFLVFRLHQILIRRLNIAMSLAHKVGSDKSLCTLVEQMPNLNPKAAARRRYEAYLALVYAVLDGGHVGEYEDRVRSLLGHGAYELATMDKLISHIWKNLQAVAQDETMWNLIQLHRRHRDSGSFQPEAFRQEAAFLSDGEPMYAFQWCPIQGQDRGVMHFEYLGVIAEEEDDDDVAMNEDDDLGMSEAVPEANSNKRPRR